MALVGRPALVVADEPTAELDHANADRVMDALLAAAAAGSTVVISSHDDRITHRADRLLRLRHGVLSSETAGRRTAAAVIDATGRLQLPPEMLELFPDRRVVVEADGDQVRLRRPEVDG
jgi:putative ABC transport system ATP-binding protein